MKYFLIQFDQDTTVECNNVAIDFLILISVKYDRNLTSDILNMSVSVSLPDKSGLSFCYNYVASQSRLGRDQLVGLIHFLIEMVMMSNISWHSHTEHPSLPPSLAIKTSRRSQDILNHQPPLILTGPVSATRLSQSRYPSLLSHFMVSR